MDCNGLLWIFRNPVNGFEDTSMDCYGVFSGRRPDLEVSRQVNPSKIKGLRGVGTGWYDKNTTNNPLR